MISLAIPSKARLASLRRTVRLAERTNAPLLICDQSPQPYHGPGITLHRPDLNGLPAARNVLLRATAADVVVMMDDDTDLASDFVERLRACIARWPEAAGWGPVLEVRPRAVRRLHRLVHLGCFHDPRRLTGARLDAPTSALFGACFAVRRELAMAVGFDERRAGYALGEDLDFCRRLAAHVGVAQPFRFCRELRAIHRCDGANRADATRRGEAKAAFLIWFARRHGGRQPATILHLLLALVVAALGHGREPGNARGVWRGVRTWWG
jgi:GT2 family glycosyltransferase